MICRKSRIYFNIKILLVQYQPISVQRANNLILIFYSWIQFI